MKFFHGLSPGTFARSAALSAMLLALLLTAAQFPTRAQFDDFRRRIEDFADQLLKQMEQLRERLGGADQDGLSATTRSIYEFYRLKDLSPFGGEAPPIRLQLGGPDRKSIKFIEELDHFYFSKFANNTSEPLRKFFTERYFAERCCSLRTRDRPRA
jgi:hypothetical protein